jgi:hypothetical protein
MYTSLMGRNLHSDKIRPRCKGPEVRGSLLPRGASCEENDIAPLSWKQNAVELIRRNFFTRISPFYLNVMEMSIRSVSQARHLMSQKTRGMYVPSYDVHSCCTGESIGVKPKSNLVMFIPMEIHLKFKGDAFLSCHHSLPHSFFYFLPFIHLYRSQLSVETGN